MQSTQQNTRMPPGQMVDLGGFRLHAMVGGQGAPTVVLEPGLGGFAQQYLHIQPRVAAFTRVVAYDRAGQGWSETSPNPRTPENLAGELKALLGQLDLQPPYVLVGHSFGGLLARIYSGLHPEEVVGMVLVDSSDVDQYQFLPDIDKYLRQMAVGVGGMKFASKVGLGRWLTKLSLGSAVKSLSKADLDTFLHAASQPRHHETVLAEFSEHSRYFGAASEVPDRFGDLPMVVVTAGKSVSGSSKVGALTADQINEAHQVMQRQLVQASTRGEHVVIPEATHLSILTQPEYAAQVVEVIRRIVERSRL